MPFGYLERCEIHYERVQPKESSTYHDLYDMQCIGYYALGGKTIPVIIDLGRIAGYLQPHVLGDRGIIPLSLGDVT